MATFGSLFSGIGGIDLGLERAGWTCRFQVEWDEWCSRVLAKHWPDVPRYGDITTVDWGTVEPVDLLAGGFPCQPFSLAGQRRGKSDERWLWPAFAAAIGALRPRLVLVENVPGLLAGHGGMGAVLGDLAALGYDAEWDCVPAAAVGAPHLRYRVWIVAHRAELGWPLADSDLWRPFHEVQAGRDAAGDGGSDRLAHPESNGRESRGPGDAEEGPQRREPDRGSVDVALADPDRSGSQGRPIQPERPGERPAGAGSLEDADSGSVESWRWGRGASQAGERWWSSEPNVGRVAHGVPSRVDRLRGLGNAVVPQVVEVIGRQLLFALESAA